MGDPRKKRKKYYTPKHPWEAERLEKEKEILENYSLKNKKEIWRMEFILKKFTDQAKRLANLRSEQAKKEKEQMINKLFKLGLIKKNADIDDVLGLTIENVLERRLQTFIYRKYMSNTIKQARQFIVHDHIFVGDKRINSPSYLVKSDEEDKIKFKESSDLIGKFGKKEEERKKKKEIKKEEIKKEEKKEKKEDKKTKEKKKKNE